MDISHITNNRLVTESRRGEQPLKKGRILQGTILKLYPQNRAQIQLGSQTFNAQLEAPLQLGNRYFFQVQSSADMIRLKVFGEKPNNQAGNNVEKLLHLLSIKKTKLNRRFLREIINENIPFTKEQLASTLAIMNEASNKEQTFELLKTMLRNHLPITNSVFQAFNMTHATSLSNQLQAFNDQLSQMAETEPQQQLLKLIRQLTGESERLSQSLITRIITEVHDNNHRLFNLFKAAKIIDNELEYTTWKTFWMGTERSIEAIDRPPFKFDQVIANQIIEKDPKTANKLQQASQSIVKQWSQKFIAVERMVLNRDFELFKQEIHTRILPLVSKAIGQHLEKLLHNEPQHLSQLMAFLETLTLDRTNIMFTHALNMSDQIVISLKDPKQSFLGQLNNMLNLLGLSYENTLTKDVSQNEPTIKSMLMQMLSQSDGGNHDRGQQLLHLINGLQLESIQETTNFIQANIHIPSESLGLNKDLYLEFESKKTAKGKIDPDDCRILFYLDLTNLEKVVIDMHVHSRRVSLTIYTNQQAEIEQHAHRLQKTLKEGFKKLNYQLTSVIFKHLIKKENQHKSEKKVRYSLQETYEGIDFRI